MRPWLAYTLIRLGVFAAALAVLLIVGVWPWLAAIVAAVIGFCVAYIFFGRFRTAMALELAERRTRPARDRDAEAEDVDSDDAGTDDARADYVRADNARADNAHRNDSAPSDAVTPDARAATTAKDTAS